ncbi:MAG: T9SS type A sorting domain-containing protein, partial [Candidatus Marinimicrobia bacterium]|nr:T9SS type A sorting domain-containing protein [Candidatus Neomarinimicrobiota bacterium]
FNPTTLLRYDLPVPSNVNFSIYDLMGREVASLVLGEQGPGFHSIVWQGKDGTGRQAPSGIYIARLVTPAYTKSIKMVLLK